MCIVRRNDDLYLAFTWLDAKNVVAKEPIRTLGYSMNSSQGIVKLIQQSSIESPNAWFRLEIFSIGIQIDEIPLTSL